MLHLNPFLNQADAGGSGGGQPSGAAGNAGSGAGGFGSGQQGSQAASQAAAAIALTDDSPIKIGDKEYKSFRDYRTEIETSAGTRTRTEVENNLRKLAQTIKQQQQQHGQQNGQQQRVDPLAGVRDQPILSGQQLAQALDGTLGPVAQAVAQLQQQNQKLTQQLQKLQGGVGTLAKERGTQERTARINGAITGIGVEGLDAKDPILNELAADILDAWEFDKPEEYGQMVTKRFTDLRKMFRALDKKELELAKSRRFTRPGGSASPQGQARFDPRNGASRAADILFGPRNGVSANT